MDDDARFLDCPTAVIDVETTGLDPRVDRIIEIAVIHMQGGVVIDRYATLVNPEQDVPEEVQRLTGIEPAQLTNAPRFAEIAAEVRARLEGKVFVAYNLAFDRAFVHEELGRAGLDLPSRRYVDPLVFVRELHKSEGSKRLTAVAERLGIPLASAHRAADDAEAAGLVLYALLPRLPERLGELVMLQQQWEITQKNEMANWKGDRGGGAIDQGIGQTLDRGNALGPAYVYGDDTDPVRAMFVHLPDAGAARRV
ncbi:MAG: 3'-5' exonuclease [Deltaproteobacteria bacterium]|jgi:DNA polymerase III epsilon subunit family exonuclease|nr:3'-5' exonuclease [Deltaproteobacteria bacterium]